MTAAPKSSPLRFATIGAGTPAGASKPHQMLPS